MSPPEMRGPGALTPGQSAGTRQGLRTNTADDISRLLTGQFVHAIGPVSDADSVEIARSLVKRAGGHCWDGRDAMLHRVHGQLSERNPDTTITFRRIRAIWHREPASIGFAEMLELAAVAATAEAEE